MSPSLLEVKNLYKSFFLKKRRVEVLRGINLSIQSGEILGLVGVSGAGKSTLLHILGILDKPSKGEVFYQGENVFSLGDKALAVFRNRKIGFVFQFHHLLPEFNALENIIMPGLIQGMSKKEAGKKAERMIESMGLKERLYHKPGELSGGEQQRVAIARALLLNPEIILADEPTGNLDSKTGEAIYDLLIRLNKEEKVTLVVVTHNQFLAGRMPRCITLVDGMIASDKRKED